MTIPLVYRFLNSIIYMPCWPRQQRGTASPKGSCFFPCNVSPLNAYLPAACHYPRHQLIRRCVPSCACRLATVGTRNAPPVPSLPAAPPPPRNGFAMREPAPAPIGPVDAPKAPPSRPDDASPRAELTFAASSLSLTAVSCASNLVAGKDKTC